MKHIQVTVIAGLVNGHTHRTALTIIVIVIADLVNGHTHWDCTDHNWSPLLRKCNCGHALA